MTWEDELKWICSEECTEIDYEERETLNKFITSLLKKQREESGTIISACKTKLQLYRAGVDGEYMGGVEYTQLMSMIDDFFNAPEPVK